MLPFEIHLTDWQRILFGTVPASFFLEIVIRVLFLFILILVSIRLMGSRMAAQLTLIEIAAVVSIAAAIGIPIQAPDRGLLPAVIIAIVVVTTERIVSRFTSRNQKTEERVFSDISILVIDAVLQPNQMKITRITRERLLAQLRSYGLTNLAQVKRLYIEPNGSFTYIKETDGKPGLSIIPKIDNDLLTEEETFTDVRLCSFCGKPSSLGMLDQKCDNCGNKEWVPATKAPLSVS